MFHPFIDAPVLQRMPEDGREFCGSRAGGILQRSFVPSGYQRLHGANRRSDGSVLVLLKPRCSKVTYETEFFLTPFAFPILQEPGVVASLFGVESLKTNFMPLSNTIDPTPFPWRTRVSFSHVHLL